MRSDYYVLLLQDGATGKDVVQAQRELLERGPWLRPYEAFATGAGKDENGHYMALVLVHADDASAEENVGLLRRIIEEEGSVLYDISWSDYIDVERSEIHAEGRALLAKLRGPAPTIGSAGCSSATVSFYTNRDRPPAHANSGQQKEPAYMDSSA